MRPEFCPDCNHERAEGDQVISFTPDPGWIAEFAKVLGPGDENWDLGKMHGPDGRWWGIWHEPVIGWAVVERHYDKDAAALGHDRRIEPVLLAENGIVITESEYRMDLRNEGAGVYSRIIRGAPSPAPALTLPQVSPHSARFAPGFRC
jgi:hypothetical protein